MSINELTLLAKVQAHLATLTDEQRLEFIHELASGYCLHCGRHDPDFRCQCWNDE